VLILDEPTSGLDPVMQEKFIEFIKSEKTRGKTVLLSSHIFSEVEALCDRVSIIKHGHIIDEFPMSKLKHNENKTYRLTFEKEQDLNSAFSKLPTDIYHPEILDGQRLRVHTNDKNINQFLQEIKTIPFSDFEYERLTLEDYFMNYYYDDIKFGGIHK